LLLRQAPDQVERVSRRQLFAAIVEFPDEVKPSQKQRRFDSEQLAQFAGLDDTDWAPTVDGFVDMAALSENTQEIGGPFARVFQEELKAFGWRRIIWRHPVPAVVVLNEESEKTHQLLLWPGKARLDQQLAEARAGGIVLSFGVDALRQHIGQQLFVRGNHLKRPPVILFMRQDFINEKRPHTKINAGY